MNTTPAKSDYLLLFRGTEWHRELSPEEIQTKMTEWMAWFNRLREEGRCTGGQSLGSEGKVVSGRSVSDGPFAEAKEMVAGYFQLHVHDIDEALAIAKECPSLAYGGTVEVRPLLARCRASELAEAQLASTDA
ncbi:MAG: YciI family protein [Chthoniobacteraceae bacterium]